MLGHVVSAMALEHLQVLRHSGGGYGEDGRVVPPSVETITVRAVVHPATGKDVEILPEGNKINETIRVYAFDPLHAASATTPADVLLWRRTHYEIVVAFDRSADGGFYKALATRQAVQ